jgi:hypothetical protein
MSATLLASLFTVIAAGSAMASVTVTSAGNIPVGGTSAGSATFVFTESAIGAFTGAGSFDVVIDDSDGGDVTFTGTPVVSAPGSLGATASIAGDTLHIATTGADNLNVESITVTGLKIKAAATASLGAVVATLANFAGGITLTALQPGGTAGGAVSAAIGIGAVSVDVAVSTPACSFVTTAVSGNPLVFATGEEVTVTAAGALAGGHQILTISATTANHAANELVSMANACAATGVIASPGTVVNVAEFTSDGEPVVLPGENNQGAEDVNLEETFAGFFTSGSTITLTIATAGVTFSHPPKAHIDGGTTTLFNAGNTDVVAQMNPALTTATWTVNTTSAAATFVHFFDFDYDVAASVPIGTHVSLTASVSTGKVIDPTTVANAVVGRVLVGVGATPTVYIGENNQASGLITITESGAGFFTDGTGANNVFAVCLVTDEQFTLAPWAIVTTGDLRLREGAVASPDNIVLGTLTTNASGSSCAYWTVWTASTAASAIEIRATDPAAPTGPLATGATNGPRLSVGPGLSPGTTQAGIYTGNLAGIQASADSAAGSLVVFAVRAFRSGVVVAAVSQPTIPRGTSGAAAGNLTITETLAGQFKPGEEICVEILPRTNQPTIQDTFLLQATQNQLPIVTTNGASGLAVGPVSASLDDFCFNVTQQAFGPVLGVITISNISYITTADAINGQVLVDVFKDGGPGVDFEAVVSNAKIGSAVAGTAATRLGVTQVGSFTTSTKVAKVGKYVTYRFDFGVAAAGQAVKIWGATKTGNDWSSFSSVTTRTANASGVVYYYIRQSSATWKSYRAQWAGGGVFTPARQARWIP